MFTHMRFRVLFRTYPFVGYCSSRSQLFSNEAEERTSIRREQSSYRYLALTVASDGVHGFHGNIDVFVGERASQACAGKR
jgi:hypothetical protein